MTVRFIRARLYRFFGKTQSDSVKAELCLIKEIIHMFVFWLALQAAQSKHPVWTSQRDCRPLKLPPKLSVYVQTLNKCNLQPFIWWREEELNVPLASRSWWFESRNKEEKKARKEWTNHRGYIQHHAVWLAWDDMLTIYPERPPEKPNQPKNKSPKIKRWDKTNKTEGVTFKCSLTNLKVEAVQRTKIGRFTK